jgi:hypothetical protein
MVFECCSRSSVWFVKLPDNRRVQILQLCRNVGEGEIWRGTCWNAQLFAFPPHFIFIDGDRKNHFNGHSTSSYSLIFLFAFFCETNKLSETWKNALEYESMNTKTRSPTDADWISFILHAIDENKFRKTIDKTRSHTWWMIAWPPERRCRNLPLTTQLIFGFFHRQLIIKSTRLTVDVMFGLRKGTEKHRESIFHLVSFLSGYIKPWKFVELQSSSRRL